MARMRFRATPVTPLPPASQRLGGRHRRNPLLPEPTVPFNESAWQLRDGLEMDEVDPSDLPTEPDRLGPPTRR